MIVLYFLAFCAAIGVVKSAVDGSNERRETKRIRAEIRLANLAKQQKIREREQAQVEKICREIERNEQNRIKSEKKKISDAERSERKLDDLAFVTAQAERDLAHYEKMLSNLDAQRDAIAMQQDAAPTGGQMWDELQTKLIRIDRQIHATEKALEMSRHKKATAEKSIRNIRKNQEKADFIPA